ncbi:MAG: RidA family protein [Burkholderiales bacterium]|nr:RidA family protein [Burkholderiales bacterium]OJX07345.1 MAG: enamine deaminase RidA [Burkholderiales bacterium 70-64]
MHKTILQPAGWAAPRGYVNGIAARGTVVSIAGQIGWNAHCEFESDDFVAQARQALANVRAVLAEAGGGPEHIVRMTWYVTDRSEYLGAGKALGAAYREFMTDAGGTVHYPAMTAVQVVALMEARAKLEIETTAVVPIAM